jgi:hypothetical protein
MNTMHKHPVTGSSGSRENSTPTAGSPRPFRQILRVLGLPTLVAVLTCSGAPGPQTDSPQWSGAAHGKRYLRINEYLFNGVQKATAIAAHREAPVLDARA